MEKRCSRRIPVALKLLLYRDGLPVAIGRTRNASKFGLFVKTDYVVTVPSQLMEVELLSKRWGRTDRSRFRALVTHSEQDGLGLQFDVQNDADYRVIGAALECAVAQTIPNSRFPRTAGKNNTFT